MPAPEWAFEQAAARSFGDEALPADLESINAVLNRSRLAKFLEEFAEDKDVRDVLALDLIANAAGFPVSSTGLAEDEPTLSVRPFRLWEYVWLYKTLRLSKGRLRVLDLGGPATPLSLLTAVTGCAVTSLDINADVVRIARECARCWQLPSFNAQIGDMRDLSHLPADGFDVILSCSVLEHLTVKDQERALGEMARVLAPGGVVGLTFDYGPGAPGANRDLPPPHEPPSSAREAVRRWCQAGLSVAGNAFSEDPIPGSLFRDAQVRYTIASLFLAKPPVPEICAPRCESAGSALGNLVIQGLPLRLYELQHLKRARLEHVKQLEECLKETQARADVLEAAAVERLAGMEEKDKAMGLLRVQFERIAAEQRARAEVLEAAAAERLACMEEKDKAIAQLRAQLELVRARTAAEHK